MDDSYIALVSGLVGALLGAAGSVLTVWIQSRHWLSQQRWSNRGKYYMELLSNLTRLKLSLEDRNEYYNEPGSEHDASRSESEQFKELSRTGHDALRAVREQIGPASVFLSDDAIEALEKLIREHWHTSESAACTAEYVSSAIDVVDAACTAVVKEAKNELTGVRGD